VVRVPGETAATIKKKDGKHPACIKQQKSKKDQHIHSQLQLKYERADAFHIFDYSYAIIHQYHSYQ